MAFVSLDLRFGNPTRRLDCQYTSHGSIVQRQSNYLYVQVPQYSCVCQQRSQQGRISKAIAMTKRNKMMMMLKPRVQRPRKWNVPRPLMTCNACTPYPRSNSSALSAGEPALHLLVLNARCWSVMGSGGRFLDGTVGEPLYGTAAVIPSSDGLLCYQ